MHIFDWVRLKFRQKLGPIPRPKKWVFIVGCYNSGTTLLHDLLASHPQVGSLPAEGQNLTDQFLLPKAVGLPRLWAIEPEHFCLGKDDGQKIDVNKLKRQWGACFNDHRRPVLIEKSPTNAGRTLWLEKHFENAHFIGIIRNGYAVAEGIRRKAGHSLELAAQQWVHSNELMLNDFERLHRKKLLYYEILVESPDAVLADILDFLDLDSDNFSVEGGPWHIHGQTALIQNMNHLSLDVLTDAERQTIRDVAGEMLDRLGYDEA